MTEESMEQRNARLIAERSGWPPGALETCLRLESEHPGWRIWWLPENTHKGFERPAGWSASTDEIRLEGADDDRPGLVRTACLYAERPEALVQRMVELEERAAADRNWRASLWRSLYGDR